jgi:glucose/arabinose dehydrogenase
MNRLAAAGPVILAVLLLAGCEGKPSNLPTDATYGPKPTLPEPKSSSLPQVKVATAVGWPAARTPVPAAGFAVKAFAEGLEHPRWMHLLPNGDVLVAETNGPPIDGKGFQVWIAKKILGRAGALVPSPNRITLLRDADGDGVAETRSVLLKGLNSPFGMAVVGDYLYIGDTDALLRVPFKVGDTTIAAKPEKVMDLPAGPGGGHWTKNILLSPDGSKLYIAVGSSSNAAEGGIGPDANRARILEMDVATKAVRVFATGLRNPNGLAWQPESGALWTTVNERDEIGNDLVPDYMTSVKDGGFYGWPYSYYGRHVDVRAKPQRPDLVATALVPDYALGAHTASLGLAFYTGDLLPAGFKNGAFVGQHGSWNRNPPSGYKVVFVPFKAGMPDGKAQDVLTGFIEKGKAYGRPVGVTIDKAGAVLVADDVGDKIWRVTPKGQ